ncbi:MAG TPA: TerC family protein [Candidatus Hydrogenedentes bacterium]|nr:TerC family protein [Candidatus Hydrogenedentota bacterium]HOV74583.1 TerC family protein [Candidatus Hydrogenedentota bacterium]
MIFWLYAGFIAFVLSALAIDLGVFNRKDRDVRTREAFAWCGVWVSLSLLFAIGVYWMYETKWLGMGTAEHMTGRQAAIQFVTAYLIEYSLSIDNMIVFAIVFAFFRVPKHYQHRVLVWGILGALIMRGAMIAAGVTLIKHFEWVSYVFGALLLLTAVKMSFSEGEVHPENNILLRMARRFYPVTSEFHGNRFFTRMNGRGAATPLFLVLLVIESSDVMFAIDSIPAVIAVTRDPFLVFTSNVFAILGLRALYFALAGMTDRFRYLKPCLIVLLGFVGAKMIAEPFFHVSTPVSFGIIVAIVGIGIGASMIPRKEAV